VLVGHGDPWTSGLHLVRDNAHRQTADKHA
jgi:hypothetical protein